MVRTYYGTADNFFKIILLNFIVWVEENKRKTYVWSEARIRNVTWKNKCFAMMVGINY